jgi:hypothetical protein
MKVVEVEPCFGRTGGITVVEDEEQKRPRKFKSPHVDGAVYTALMIQHDDPDNDPRAWDWSLVDFTGVTDRRVVVKCVGFWDNDSERNEEGPWSEQPDLYTVRPTFAARRETRGRLDRGPGGITYGGITY